MHGPRYVFDQIHQIKVSTRGNQSGIVNHKIKWNLLQSKSERDLTFKETPKAAQISAPTPMTLPHSKSLFKTFGDSHD
jgi:hypothetical protein